MLGPNVAYNTQALKIDQNLITILPVRILKGRRYLDLLFPLLIQSRGLSVSSKTKKHLRHLFI